jgi:hypothetical protein
VATNAPIHKNVQNTPATEDDICVYLKYGRRLELRLLLPENLKRAVKTKLELLQGKDIEDPRDLLHRIGQVERLGVSVTILGRVTINTWTFFSNTTFRCFVI